MIHHEKHLSCFGQVLITKNICLILSQILPPNDISIGPIESLGTVENTSLHLAAMQLSKKTFIYGICSAARKDEILPFATQPSPEPFAGKALNIFARKMWSHLWWGGRDGILKSQRPLSGQKCVYCEGWILLYEWILVCRTLWYIWFFKLKVGTGGGWLLLIKKNGKEFEGPASWMDTEKPVILDGGRIPHSHTFPLTPILPQW